MKRLELVRRAIAHTGGDRVPYGILLTSEACLAYGRRLMDDYPDERVSEDYAKDRLSLEEAVSLSIGSHVLYVDAPWWDWHYSAGRFPKCPSLPESPPDTVGYGDYGRFFEHCAYLRSRYDTYLLATVGRNKWKNPQWDIEAHPKYPDSLSGFIAQKNLVMLENILAAGLFDGILLEPPGGTGSAAMPPFTWDGRIGPGETPEYRLIKKYGKQIWVRACEDIGAALPGLCRMGIDVLHSVKPEDVDLWMLKEEYGSIFCYYGGVSAERALSYGAPGDVIRETEETIALMSENGGYITAPAQELGPCVPYENLRALVDTARAYAV